MEALEIIEKIVRENAFEHKKEKPGLNANRPSNNWAQIDKAVYHLTISLIDDLTLAFPE